MAAPPIVVGVDFSEGGRRALQAVGVLARASGARLRLVHAFPPGKPRLSGAPRRALAASMAAAEAAEALQLTRLAERMRAQGFVVDTVAVQGKAAPTLLAQAKRHRAGLIAVGTAGRQGLQGLFLGSVAQAVLRQSPVPVLVTPARQRSGRRRAGPVLAAVDLDDAASAVLAAAAALARDLGVKVHLLHAVPVPFIGPSFPEDGIAYSPNMLERDEQDAGIRLSRLAEAVRRVVHVDVTVTVGDPATHVLALAQRLGAAAVVVGRRKSTKRLGSVSAALVQALDRPVVVVPAGFGSRRR